jgi:acyl carrier protein
VNDQEILQLLRSAHEFAQPDRADVRAFIEMGATLSDLGVTSISAMEMAGFIEDEIGVQFPDDELANIGSVSDFVKLVRQYSAKVAP